MDTAITGSFRRCPEGSDELREMRAEIPAMRGIRGEVRIKVFIAGCRRRRDRSGGQLGRTRGHLGYRGAAGVM